MPDTSEPLGIRDRAMMELLYSTGIRRRELMELKFVDLDVDRRALMIRQGKGNKDRLVPVGERAIDWIEKYYVDVRPGLAADPDDGILFLSSTGRAFSPNHLTGLIHRYIEATGIRFIQEMLGHANLKKVLARWIQSGCFADRGRPQDRRPMIRFGVIRFPGSNCDDDAVHAASLLDGASAEIVSRSHRLIGRWRAVSVQRYCILLQVWRGERQPWLCCPADDRRQHHHQSQQPDVSCHRQENAHDRTGGRQGWARNGLDKRHRDQYLQISTSAEAIGSSVHPKPALMRRAQNRRRNHRLRLEHSRRSWRLAATPRFSSSFVLSARTRSGRLSLRYSGPGLWP